MDRFLRQKREKDDWRQTDNKPHSKKRMALLWGGLFCLSIILNLAARLSGAFAEWYAVHIYPVMVGTIGRLFSLFPFSVIEVMLYLAALSILTGIVAILTGRLSFYKAMGIVGRVVVVIFFLFTVNCGINYQRTPFSQRAGFVTRESTEEELIELCEFLVEEINDAAREISVDADGHCVFNGNLAQEARKAMQTAAKDYRELEGYYPDAKPVFSTWYLSYQLLQGVYSPFTVEANYNHGMPDQDKPSTICHELSHLKGFMREDEANFVSYLACRVSESPEFRYSGSILAYIYCGNALYDQNPEALRQVREKLCDQAVRDLLDHNAYWDTYRGKVAEVSDKVNDVYLKVNSQEEGTRSYGRMVDLLLEWKRTGNVVSEEKG